MLTDKQEAFAVEIVMNGGNASDAYRKCYNSKKMKDSTIWKKASELKALGKVADRIKELRMSSYTKSILSIEERKQVLSELGLLGSEKAIDTLNKMDGLYDKKAEEVRKPIRVQVERIPKKD